MKNSKTITTTAIAVLFAVWIYSFFFVPTFDLDESLYRRVSEEMKWSGNYWLPTWDRRPFYHKPPFFYWLIVFFSRLVDGADAGVSIFAARLPSFLSTLGIIWGIGTFTKKTTSHLSPLVVSFLLWGCALFPVFTSTSVIFDPLQTLAFLPCLLIPHRAFSESRSITRNEFFLIAAGMFSATAIKGLTGLILPSLAIGLHLAISNFRSLWKEGLRFFSLSFVPAAALSALYYFLLDVKIGRDFTREFFLVHHFGRGTQAMEAHFGPIYYYFALLFAGSGLLMPILFLQSVRTAPDWKKLGYPLSFAFGALVFFSLSATKLPHYIWPVWPALVLQILTLQNQQSLKSERIRTPRTWTLFLIPILVLGLALFWLVFHPEIVPQTEIEGAEILFLTMAGMLCLLTVLLIRKIIVHLELAALFMALITALVAVPVSSIAARVWVVPFYEVAAALKKYNPSPTDCIRDSGPMTATLSLALGQVLGRGYTHNRCEPGMMKFLIAPNSKKAECAERKMSALLEGRTLTLCGKL